jgi:hypothetical protein
MTTDTPQTVSMVTPGDTPGVAVVTRCEHCDRSMRPARRGRARRYCDEACRSASRRGSVSSATYAAHRSGAGRGEARRPAAGPVLPGGRGGEPTPVNNRSRGALGNSQSFEPPQVRGPVVDRSQWTDFDRAEFTTPGTVEAGTGRRRVREALRGLLNEVSSIERSRRCGVGILGGAAIAKISDGVAYMANIESCARIWSCPVCAAKIRARRADEITEGIVRHFAAGGGGQFATLTVQHQREDPLRVTFDVLRDVWQFVRRDRSVRSWQKRCGFVGGINALEVMYGLNGWHPHRHMPLLTREHAGLDDLRGWFYAVEGAYVRHMRSIGWPVGVQGIRFDFRPISASTAANLGSYVAKVDDRAVANETARMDLKSGRRGSMTPLQLLAEFGSTGNAFYLDRFHEYERGTVGRSAIRWDRGLRALLIPDLQEATDDEIAAEDRGGDEAAVLLPRTWHRVRRIPGARAAVLEALEAGGFAALIDLLIGYGLAAEGVVTPDAWRTMSFTQAQEEASP